MGTLSEKNPESQENILLRIPMLLNYAEGLESYFQEQYIRLFIFFLKNEGLRYIVDTLMENSSVIRCNIISLFTVQCM